MPLIRADRVKESSTSTGTSALLLNGADSTYRTFASVCAVGDTVYYAIAHRSANEWEVGLGTYSAVNTLTRTTVHASSNANAAVAFSTGTKDVLLALTKAQLETYATLAGTETLTNKTISGANNTITNVSLTTGATGTLPLANGGTGTTTAQLAINALAGAVTSGSYLRGNGTNVVMAAIQAADVPTLNQNTTGTASGSVSGTASYLAKFTGTNVVGNSLIYDSGSHIGIGTTTLNQIGGTRSVCVNGSADAAIELNANNVIAGLLYANSSGLYIQSYGPVGLRIFTSSTLANAVERIRIDVSGNVGIGTTSPGAQLQVTTAAAATKGLIVKGASAQSANLQEWQNGAGTVVASVAPSGIAVFGAQTGAQNSSVIRAWCTPASTANGQILTSLTGADGAGERYRMSIGNTSTYGFLQTYENAIGYTMGLSLQPSGGRVHIGGTNPGARLEVDADAATTKGLIVQGASGQSANLQEWQNSAGTVLAAVNSAGTLIPYGGIYTQVANGFVSELYINQQVSEYTQSFYRTLPSVVGDYVEFIEVNDTTSTRYEFSISVVNYPYWILKRYEFTTTWNNATNGVVPPVSISNRNNALDFDYELETVSVGSYYRRFRIKRTKGTTANVQAMVLMRSFGDFATHSRTELTGTGTSTYSSYITRSYDYVNPNIAAPPPANYSGSGTPLSLYASNAIGTGAGGGLALQAGNAASTGGGGSITLYTGAGAGGGVGGAILSRSQADSYNRSHKFILVRSIPDTVGNYVELGRIGWLAGAILKVSVFASRGAFHAAFNTYNALGKEYEIYTHYYSSGTVAPRAISGDLVGGRQPNEFELELAWNGNGYQVLRLRRSKADATNFSGYTATVVIEQLIWSPHAFEFVELSGTGTSALTNAYLTNTGTYCYPALIPPPTVGTSGAGTDLAIYGGSAIGTGAGGSIILQPGAQATSGGDGTVISRRGANGVSNIHHFQVGTSTYAFIDSSGRLCITPEVSTTVMPVDCGLFVTPRNNANTIGVVVRGVSGQAGNLQQWQNNAGTVLSAINSAGDFTNTGGQAQSEKFGNGAVVSVGQATAIGNGASAGQLSTAVGYAAGTTGVTGVAVGAQASANDGSVAVGRQAGASGGSAIAIGPNASATGANSIAVGRLSASSGGISIGYNFTGVGLGYTSFNASTNGTSSTGAIAVYAGDGANNGNFSRQHSMLGTWSVATYASRLGRVQLRVNDYTTDREAIRYESDGANALTSIGGSAIIANTTLAVQPAVSGNKGVVVKGASGQSANLQEWQNNSGTALASIDSAGNFGVNSITSTGAFDTYFDTWYGAVKRRVYRVSVPSTIGNYQEIFRLNWSSNVIAKIKVLAFGSGIANAKEYDFNSSYGMTGVLAPLRSAYLYNTVAVQYELENDWNAGTGWNTIRVKRTSGTDALNLFVYVEVLDATSGHPQAVSGTGTSSIGGILGSYASFTSITPPDVVGGNGNGYQLSLYGGNALGTGNGGNILLQAGALSTSGSNGKVIVRGLASNTANLQEWQNSSGTALALVDASGNVQTAGSIRVTSNTPSAFTADQNNLALSASGFQRLSGTAARNITGIAPPSGSHVDGRMIRLYNVGTFNLTLKHNNASSTAANRFWNVQAIDIIVGANDYAELIYDGTNNGSGAAGWRVA